MADFMKNNYPVYLKFSIKNNYSKDKIKDDKKLVRRVCPIQKEEQKF